jgi:hypothetical protein
MGWQHVNLGERFKLTGQKEPLEINLLINRLDDFLALLVVGTSTKILDDMCVNNPVCEL